MVIQKNSVFLRTQKERLWGVLCLDKQAVVAQW